MSTRSLAGCASLIVLIGWCGWVNQVKAESTAFYYGASVPSELLVAYDQIVVEPDNLSDSRGLFDRASKHAVPVAYLSIGEQGKARQAAIDPSWRLGQNQAWGSSVMNVAHPGYQRFLLERFETLWAAGYRRFFLDTLDSYLLGSSDPAQRELLRRAVGQLIRSMATRHPDARWLLNRGFELLPDIAELVHGVVAESLFDRWDAAHSAYVRVPEADRAWLLARLREVRDRYHLPVTVIDYRPSSEREQARETARKIAALGFAPWVCESSLMSVGVGPVEIMPRRILILGDAAEGSAPTGPARFLAPVLEYLGYVPEYRDASLPLPEFDLAGRYQGVISVFAPGFVLANYGAWLLRQVQAGVRVVVFGGLGFAADGPEARQLGIFPVEPPRPGEAQAQPVAIVTRDAMIGFEAEPLAHGIEGVAVQLKAAGAQQHLVIRTAYGAEATAIATAAWGGLALSHVFALRGLQGERAWVLDPFLFLTRALNLPDMPVPDVTTESGGRVALFVIEANGLSEPARLRGRPPVWSVVRREILDDSPWPHAIALADRLEPEAKRDAAAALNLLAGPATYSAEIAAGSTAPRAMHRSLTALQPLFESDASGASEEIHAPIAPDASYLEGSSEAYALRGVIETFQYTDAPRRLRPLALHYHASSASSPGGLDALGAVYDWLANQPLFAVRVEDYKARIRAFREQVIVRHLDDSYGVLGGEALRTLRVPAQLGLPDLGSSSAVASVARLTQGIYVTFAGSGARRLQLGASALHGPHLTQTNGRVESFAVEEHTADRVQVRLRVVAELAAQFRVAGLAPAARCSLQLHKRVVSAVADAHGSVGFNDLEADTGATVLSCSPGLTP
jgi:hypothetical protein